MTSQAEHTLGRAMIALAKSEGHRPKSMAAGGRPQGVSFDDREKWALDVIQGEMTTVEVRAAILDRYGNALGVNNLSHFLSKLATRGCIVRHTPPGRRAIWGPAK